MYIDDCLINEFVCEDIINFYDSSQYLYAFSVYSRRKGARTEPRMVERKVAQMVDIFSIAVRSKLLFLLSVQQFVPAYASRAHITPGAQIFSVYAISSSAQIESANLFLLFSTGYTTPLLVSSPLPLLFLSVIAFFYEKALFSLPRVNASSTRAFDSSM